MSFSSNTKDIVQIVVKSEGEKHFADFHALITRPLTKEVSVRGPKRDSKPEAIKDSEVLGKAFQLEGETGVKRMGQRLMRKTWTSQELSTASVSLEGLLASDPLGPLNNVTVGPNGPKPERLIPPGEGWIRYNDEMLWEPRSEVYFSQTGTQMGQYLMKIQSSQQWQVVNPPNQSTEAPINVRAGGANILRKGAKLERTVLLPELPKIARLAMKFPLSFLDSPSSAFALFQGIRSAESADWCAKNFHTKLIPLLAKKIHKWETKELQDMLERVLKDLDEELLKSTHAFSGCSAVLALLLGDRLVITGVGQFRVVLLSDDGSTRELLAGTHDYRAGGEQERLDDLRAVVRDEGLYRSPSGLELNDAFRILFARSVFEVLQIEPAELTDEKQIRTAYRKLALKVHPDKRSEDPDVLAFNKAFSRLDSAKELLENMINADLTACKELGRVLTFEVHARETAAELLGVDGSASTDTEQVAAEAEKASKKGIAKLAKMEHVAGSDYEKAVGVYKEAVETIRRPTSKEALPRQEALLKQPLPTSRAMGVRDLRFPSAFVKMQPESISWVASPKTSARIALLCGASVTLSDQKLSSSSSSFKRCPKASALRWCQESPASASSAFAACLRFEPKVGDEPATKRQKTAAGQPQKAGTIFLRHILFRHQQLRVVDPAARREGTARGPGEAEAAALSALQQLSANPNAFVKLCRELSDCATAEQPGNLAGHLGWIGRGEQEPPLEEAGFALSPNEFGDIVVTSRGVHVIQRLG